MNQNNDRFSGFGVTLSSRNNESGWSAGIFNRSGFFVPESPACVFLDLESPLVLTYIAVLTQTFEAVIN